MREEIEQAIDELKMTAKVKFGGFKYWKTSDGYRVALATDDGRFDEILVYGLNEKTDPEERRWHCETCDLTTIEDVKTHMWVRNEE